MCSALFQQQSGHSAMSINFNYEDELEDIIESGIYQSLDEVSIEEQDFYLLRLEEENIQAFEAEIGLDHPLLDHEANEQAEQEYYELEYLKTLDVLKVGIEIFNYGVDLCNSSSMDLQEAICCFSKTIQIIFDHFSQEGIADRSIEEGSGCLEMAHGVLNIRLGNKDKSSCNLYRDCKINLALVFLAANAYFLRGKLSARNNNIEDALKDFNEIILAIPHYINAYLYRGSLYLTLNDYRNALQDFDKVLQDKPMDAIAIAGKNHALVLMSK